MMDHGTGSLIIIPFHDANSYNLRKIEVIVTTKTSFNVEYAYGNLHSLALYFVLLLTPGRIPFDSNLFLSSFFLAHITKLRALKTSCLPGSSFGGVIAAHFN